MSLDGVFIRYVQGFAMSIRGITTPNDDGTFSVYINADLTPEQQSAALDHELRHIRFDHLYDFEPVANNELVACGQTPRAEVKPQSTITPAKKLIRKSAPITEADAKQLIKDLFFEDERFRALENKWLFDVG